MRSRYALPLFAAAAIAAAGCATGKQATTVHPADYGKPPVCSECHDSSRSALDHVGGFGASHRLPAAVSRDTCMLCHLESSCAACHANDPGMSPAETLRGRPDRTVIHRGDWLTRHRVEGKVNPVSCAACHARRDNGRCRECHR